LTPARAQAARIGRACSLAFHRKPLVRLNVSSPPVRSAECCEKNSAPSSVSLGTAVFLIVTIGAHLIVGYEHPQVLSPELTAFLLRMDEQGENTL
jgi:hypothetical protein